MTRKLTYEERRKNWRAVSLLGKRGAVKKSLAHLPEGEGRGESLMDLCCMIQEEKKVGSREDDASHFVCWRTVDFLPWSVE